MTDADWLAQIEADPADVATVINDHCTGGGGTVP